MTPWCRLNLVCPIYGDPHFVVKMTPEEMLKSIKECLDDDKSNLILEMDDGIYIFPHNILTSSAIFIHPYEEGSNTNDVTNVDVTNESSIGKVVQMFRPDDEAVIRKKLEDTLNPRGKDD